MIPIDCKIFAYTGLFTFFGTNHNIGEFIGSTSKERMAMNIIFVGATQTHAVSA